MRYEDIRKALTSKIKELGLKVYHEDITQITRPCYFIDLIDYIKEFNSNYRELKQLDFDIMYFPKNKEGNNSETITALENLDDNFEVLGNKILSIIFPDKALNRYLTLKNTRMHIVDNIGHYEFSIELYDSYGKPIDMQLVQELHLNFNKEVK